MKNLKRISLLLGIMILFSFSVCFAEITEKQGEDVATFAKNFIEIGNSRRDEKGFPLLTYALSGNWKTCIEIRSKGYTEQMYYVKNNGYYIVNGRYLELGNKWCMDCGTTVLYLLKKTTGLELWNSAGEPWHVQDVYNDALKGSKSQYFDMIYQSVSVGRIDYSKLKKGDVIAYLTSHGNHGMLYLGDGLIAHANRDMIRSYGDNKISGFQVGRLDRYFLPGTVVRVMRIKDGIIPEDKVVSGILTWPDNGETMNLLDPENPSKVLYIKNTDGTISNLDGTITNTDSEMIIDDIMENISEDNASNNVEVKDAISITDINISVEENKEKETITSSNIILNLDEEKLKEKAEDVVISQLSGRELAIRLLSIERPIIYGPFIQNEFAKVQFEYMQKESA